MVVRSPVPDTSETVRIRWVFGPEGQYRVERGPITLVFDTEYLFGGRTDTGQSGGRNWRASLPEGASERSGVHNRYHGDIVMGTGLMAIGMIYPEVAARLEGTRWADAFAGEMVLKYAPDENVGGHPCWRIVGRTPKKKGQFTMWIDKDLRMWRKWKDGNGFYFTSIQYDIIRVDPTLKGDEFLIPQDERKKADERKD